MPDAPPSVLEEVGREYERTLSIPEHTPVPQYMLMPVGVLGAGKTTVIRPLAKRLGLIRLSTDEVRKLLKERGYSYVGARDVVQALVEKYLDAGHSLAIDANTGSATGLTYNAKSAERYPRVRQIFIRIDPPDDYIINKLKNHRHTWLFTDAEHAVESFRANKEKFVFPDLSYAYTFDPSRDDFPKQLEEGALAIQHASQERVY